MQDYSVTTWLTTTFSWAVIGGAVMGILPPIAVTVAIIVGLLQIYENRTFQHWWNNHKQKRAAIKLARYKARVIKEQAIIDAVNVTKQARVEARQVVIDAEAKAAQVMATPLDLMSRQ